MAFINYGLPEIHNNHSIYLFIAEPSHTQKDMSHHPWLQRVWNSWKFKSRQENVPKRSMVSSQSSSRSSLEIAHRNVSLSKQKDSQSNCIKIKLKANRKLSGCQALRFCFVFLLFPVYSSYRKTTLVPHLPFSLFQMCKNNPLSN